MLEKYVYCSVMYMILVVIGAGHSTTNTMGIPMSLRGLVLLPPMMYGTWQCSVLAIHPEHLKLDLDSTYVVSHRLPCLRHSVHLLVAVSVTERVGGNSLIDVALIDSESVAIATLWRLLTPTVGVNSLGL